MDNTATKEDIGRLEGAIGNLTLLLTGTNGIIVRLALVEKWASDHCDNHKQSGSDIRQILFPVINWIFTALLSAVIGAGAAIVAMNGKVP